jgi:hypothetical protein
MFDDRASFAKPKGGSEKRKTRYARPERERGEKKIK